MNTEKYLENFFKVFNTTHNLHEIQDLCKRMKVNLLAKDTNHTSCIVKYKGVKYYLAVDKVERL